MTGKGGGTLEEVAVGRARKMTLVRTQFDYRLESDTRFLNRIQQARASIREGKGVPLEKLARKLPASSAQPSQDSALKAGQSDAELRTTNRPSRRTSRTRFTPKW